MTARTALGALDGAGITTTQTNLSTLTVTVTDIHRVYDNYRHNVKSLVDLSHPHNLSLQL